MKQAVEMRRFDDMAKILNKKTPNIIHFKHYLEEAHSSFSLGEHRELKIS
jgi:predicted HD phosphohydrolase